MQSLVRKVALIGSFRQHYDAVLRVYSAFTHAGLTVTTPKGLPISEHGIPFVRFESDPSDWPDEMVQVVALHRILAADFVYVVAPNGYVGRTTCYEIGRIIHSQQPLYFSNPPNDLPILVPDKCICSAEKIIISIHNNIFRPVSLWQNENQNIYKLERDLIEGSYRDI